MLQRVTFLPNSQSKVSTGHHQDNLGGWDAGESDGNKAIFFGKGRAFQLCLSTTVAFPSNAKLDISCNDH
jgi:hypothetical protein